MNLQRNRWLLGGLALVVVFFVGDQGYKRLIGEPARFHEQQKSRLDQRLRDAKLELAKAKRVGRELEALEKKSLPWDPELARARYQDWLLQLVKESGLVNANVDSGEPITVSRADRKTKRSVEIFTRYTFTVRAKGDLAQITRFLFDFYRGGHLHKIRSFSLTPLGQSQQVNLNVTIEALSLPQADREAELATLVSEQLARPDVRDYQLIARRNLFGMGGGHWAWKQIVLTAVTYDVQGVAEAWFTAGKDKETRILRIGEVLAIPSVQMKLVSVTDNRATVEVDGQRYQLLIGQSLNEAAPLVEPSVAGSS
jgi:hypothetical protein